MQAGLAKGNAIFETFLLYRDHLKWPSKGRKPCFRLEICVFRLIRVFAVGGRGAHMVLGRTA